MTRLTFALWLLNFQLVFQTSSTREHCLPEFKWTSTIAETTILVMVLAGIEIIFFTVAGIVLCFGFSMRIMLITHRCFSCCWAVFTLNQGLSSSHALPAEKVGDAQEAGKGHSQDSWPKLAKGIFHTIWHHAQYINWGELAGGRARCSGTSWASVVGGEQLHCASLVLYILLLLLFSLPFLPY